jgi:hypothetical protein
VKINQVAKQQRLASLSPLKRKVLEYLESHNDEVYPLRDAQLRSALSVKESALDWTLWWLSSNRYIGKEKLDRVYFGSLAAVEELRKQSAEQSGRSRARRARKAG